MEDCVGVVHLTIKSMKEFISAILFFSVFTASAQKPGSTPSMEERIKKTKEIISSEIQLNSTFDHLSESNNTEIEINHKELTYNKSEYAIN